jgi:HEAT repeat protein
MGLFGGPNIEKLKAKGDVSGLIKALGDKNPTVRQAAAAALRSIGGPEADEALAARDEALAAHAVIARARDLAGDKLEQMKVVGKDIKELESKGYVRALLEVLSSTATDWAVRSWAAQALGRLQDPRAVDPLLGATRDPNWGVVCSAAGALGEIGDPRATDRLKALLTWKPQAAPIGAVREAVAGYRNAPQMSRAFEAAAASEMGQAQAEDVQKAAREALEKLDGQSSG